jgi:hypothetical protein
VLRKSGRLSSVAGSVVEYVNPTARHILLRVVVSGASGGQNFVILVLLSGALLDPSLSTSAEVRTGALGLLLKSNIVKLSARKILKIAKIAAIIS